MVTWQNEVDKTGKHPRGQSFQVCKRHSGPQWNTGGNSLLKRGQRSHPWSTGCQPGASWRSTRIRQLFMGFCTRQFWFKCQNPFSESISMKIIEISYRISDPFCIVLFNFVRARNNVWPKRSNEGVPLLHRFSAGSAVEEELFHSDFRLRHAYSFPADDPHRQSVYDCISLYWLAPEQERILSLRSCHFAQITKTCWHWSSSSNTAEVFITETSPEWDNGY